MTQARFAAISGTVRYAICLMSGALLASCVAAPNANSVGKVAKSDLESPSQGIVIFSVGAKEHCPGAANVGHIKREDADGIVTSFSIDADGMRSDFADHQGVVNAIALPAGHYVIRPGTPDADQIPAGAPAFAFDVNAGETTYIGDLFMPEACTAQTKYQIRDRYERDMMAARIKNALLAKHKVQRRLMKRVAHEA
jgi:hypothetical protein